MVSYDEICLKKGKMVAAYSHSQLTMRGPPYRTKGYSLPTEQDIIDQLQVEKKFRFIF